MRARKASKVETGAIDKQDLERNPHIFKSGNFLPGNNHEYSTRNACLESATYQITATDDM